MHHRPGKSMGKSDALSQRVDHGTGTKDNNNLTLLTLNFFTIRALEGLEVLGEERDIMKEIRWGMESDEQQEVVVKAAKEFKKSPTKSVKPSKWLTENGLLY